jgi:hypothetical protein
MILGINKSGIATLVNTRENIIIPYLIVCDSCLAVETTLCHRLINSNSINSCDTDMVIGNIDIHALLCHHKLLSQFEYAVVDCQPFKWRIIGEE